MFVVIGEDANNSNLSSRTPSNDAEAKCRAPPRARLAPGVERRRRRRRRPNRDPDRAAQLDTFGAVPFTRSVGCAPAALIKHHLLFTFRRPSRHRRPLSCYALTRTMLQFFKKIGNYIIRRFYVAT